MCVQNIIVITQIFEIFCQCLFIHVIQLFVVCNAFSVDWLISTRIRWSVTLKSRLLSIIVALGQSFKLCFSCLCRGESSLFFQTASVIVIGSRYPSTFLIIIMNTYIIITYIGGCVVIIKYDYHYYLLLLLFVFCKPPSIEKRSSLRMRL